MFFKSLLFVPAFAIAIGISQQSFADDAVPTEMQKELAEAKQSLIDATERLRRVEAKIAELKGDNQSDDLDGADFTWRVLGLRVEEIAASVIQSANEANRTQYRGAMKVTDVRTGGPADTESIRIGDLLLGIDGMQTITNAHLLGIASRESKMLAQKKVKFYILRNGQTLFGHFDLTQRQ
jgi:S1-C subfamily serine protease